MGSSFQAGWIWEAGGVEYGVLMTVINQDDDQSLDELAADPPLSEEDIAAIVESTLE